MITDPKYCPQCGTPLERRKLADRVRPVCPACGFIFYMNPVVAAGTLVEQEGRVALIQRGVDPGRGRWGLPAGYVEADESAEEAAVRETYEEAHLHVEIEGLLDAFSYTSEQSRGVLLIYAAHAVEGTLEAGDDATNARWFGPDELPDVAFRTHREVLRRWRQARAVIYRPATLADAEVATMLSELYPYEQGCECARFMGDPEKRLFVAVDSDQVIGFSGVEWLARNRTAEIQNVFVHPRYRRWGIGTQLIKTCVEFSREAGARAVYVQTPVSDPAWTVYLKAGFHVSGFANDYFAPSASKPEPALLLTCDLFTAAPTNG